jgi:hypothetical protein
MLSYGKDFGAGISAFEHCRIAWPGSLATAMYEETAQSDGQKHARTSHLRSTPGSWKEENEHR